MSEFARNADGPASATPVALAPGDATTAGVVKPAVLVDETTVPVQAPRAAAPMTIAPAVPEVASVDPSNDGIAPAATNLNRVPEQPKGKLLTPDEKAKVIAELEALAKKQSAQLGKGTKASCAADNLDPTQRVASATGDDGC